MTSRDEPSPEESTFEHGWCSICQEPTPQEGLTDHFRVMHPDLFAEFPRWPDGKLAITDETLTPEEFLEP